MNHTTNFFIKTFIKFFQDKKIIASRQKFIFITTQFYFRSYVFLTTWLCSFNYIVMYHADGRFHAMSVR
jgi:hypothetical protein